MKLLIAIPTKDQMPYQFVESLLNLTRRLDADGIDYDVAFQGGTLVYVGRDKLALKGISGDYTHMLWLDADMVFTEDLFADLYDTGKKFVTGVAHSRREPYQSCIFMEIYPGVQKHMGEYPTNTFKIAGCGLACALIDVEIVRDVWSHHSTAFFPTREFGEDIAFCKRVQDLGHEIWAEPSVKVGHVGSMVIYPDYEEIYRNCFLGVQDA
jgi:hypothetical protein